MEPRSRAIQALVDRKDAFCPVVYSSDAPNNRTLAAAFFPNCPAELRMVKVFPLAFVFRDAMVNTFCHELGLVLGLRHEFAAHMEKDGPSVHWGFPNPESVMNYYNHPLEMAVHELGIVLINGLYAYEGDSLEGFPIDVVSPTSRPLLDMMDTRDCNEEVGIYWVAAFL